MFFMIQRSAYSLELFKIMMQNIIVSPVILFLILFTTISFCIDFAITFYIEYQYFGISVIDFSTFQQILDFSLGDHIKQTIFCFIAFFIFAMHAAFVSYICNYVLVVRIRKKTFSMLLLFESMYYNLKEIIRDGCILACEYINYIDFNRMFDVIQDMFDGTYHNISTYNTISTNITYGELIDNPGITLKETRKNTQNLLEKTFVLPIERQYSFFYISCVMLSIILSISMYLCNHNKIAAENAFLFGLLLFTIYYSIITMVCTYFNALLYCYCKDGIANSISSAVFKKMVVEHED